MTWQVALVMLPGLVVGLTLHEFAHAWSASLLGDGFARRQGRVSLNPLRHLSPLGTLAIFLLPIGWGRPVPVNLYNFERPRRDYLLTSLAGPAANVVVLAVCLALMLLTRHTYYFAPPYDLWVEIAHLVLQSVAIINALLAAFNLIPIPPLDGSKIWPCVIPGLKPAGSRRMTWISMMVLLALIWTGSLGPVARVAVEGARRLMPVADSRLFHERLASGAKALHDEQWDEAERAFTAALEINPRSSECLFGRSNARVQQAQWTAALEDIDRALALHAEPYYYRHRAMVLRNLGRDKEAEIAEATARAMARGGDKPDETVRP